MSRSFLMAAQFQVSFGEIFLEMLYLKIRVTPAVIFLRLLGPNIFCSAGKCRVKLSHMLLCVLGPRARPRRHRTLWFWDACRGRVYGPTPWLLLWILCASSLWPATVFDPSRTKTPRKEENNDKNHHPNHTEFTFAGRAHSKWTTRADYCPPTEAMCMASNRHWPLFMDVVG